MAVSTGTYMEGFHRTSQAMGQKLVSSDFTLQIDGYEENYILTKQFPVPKLSVGEGIDISAPLGTKYKQRGQAIFSQTGAVTFYETVAGQIDRMLLSMICKGGSFNAWVYLGTPRNYTARYRILNCGLVMENPDADMENSTTPLTITGQIEFEYYGTKEAGNVPHLMGGEGQGGQC